LTALLISIVAIIFTIFLYLKRPVQIILRIVAIVIISEDHTGTGMVRVGADNIIRLEKGKTDIDRFID